ncbi:CBS domain-containing protein [Olivibacter domesticus]|uniref:CBS domain-containing protein n=1 Tax=Olivibacter domesticus TaxID=407022 RepID=A0A1H7XCF6_OLID1|nr:CBS domain-containing protein [Olivibacter domesticus]SEM31345.1 CBS domain-containing protein [Olivibacter domesticus]
MTTGEIIKNDIYPLSPKDTAQYMLDRMTEYKVSQLPVVQNNFYQGLVSEDDLQEQGQINKVLKLIFVYENQHIYDALRLFHVHHLDVLPVVDEQQQYKGVLILNNIIDYLAESLVSDEQGGIIVLEIGNRDNSMSHIAQIVESDNAQILSSSVRSFPESTRLEVTLKLNRTDISSIVASFLRHDYIVKAIYNDKRGYDSTRDRYDQLMNYLDL